MVILLSEEQAFVYNVGVDFHNDTSWHRVEFPAANSIVMSLSSWCADPNKNGRRLRLHELGGDDFMGRAREGVFRQKRHRRADGFYSRFADIDRDDQYR